MKKFFVVLFLTTLCLAEQGFNIDNADAQIVELMQDSDNSKLNLDANWQEVKTILIENIQKIQQDLDNQNTLCVSRLKNLNDTQLKIENTNHYIDWISKRISDNIRKIKELEKARCAANMGFVESIKQDKITLKLLKFLREAVENKESMSLLQQKQLFQRIQSFIQMWQDKDYAGILSQKDYDLTVDDSVHQRSAEEVGTGHVDDGRQQIDVADIVVEGRKDWQTYKKEILALLQQIEDDIAEKMKKEIENEVAAGVGLADFKIHIDSENKDLDRHLNELADLIIKLEKELPQDEQKWEECKTEAQNILNLLDTSKTDYNTQKSNYEAENVKIAEERQLLVEILALFRSGVGSGGEDFKARVDDYAVDQKFDDNSYGARELDAFKQ